MADTQPVIAYVALGANLGDRRANIRSAVSALDATPGVRVTRVSTLFENPAVGGPADSPAFLNGVAEVETTLGPHELLARLLEIERSLGRERRQKWEPRPIDLDLILYGDRVMYSLDLQVPHPLMHERRFVLEPLAEIAPDAVHPVSELTVRELLADLEQPEPPPLVDEGVINRDVSCAGCGYNLRGLPLDRACPECGRPLSDTLRPVRSPANSNYHLFEKVETFAATHGLAPDAVGFVLEAVLEAVSAQQRGQHASAVQVVRAFAQLVRAEFLNDDSAAANAVLSWGIRRSEDLGRIVFAMVGDGWFAASSADRIEDFNGLFVTEALFGARPLSG